MIDQKMLEEVKEWLKKGAAQEEIKNSLINKGLSEGEIGEIFFEISKNVTILENAKTKLSSASELLKKSFAFYKERWKTLLGITAIYFLPLIILSFFTGYFDEDVKVNAFKTSSFVEILLIIVMFLTFFILQIAGQLAAFFLIKKQSEKIGIAEAYKLGLSKVKPYLWVTILNIFLVFGGMMFFVIPGILFSIWFWLASLIVVFEDERGMNALLKSREYMRGIIWKVFWRGIVLVVVLFGLGFGIGFIFGIITEILKSPFLENVLGFLLQILVTPLAIIYYAFLFLDIQALKKDMVLTPVRSQKIVYFVIAGLGIVIAVAIHVLIINALNKFKIPFL